MSPAILVKAAASILTNEKSRKAVGWVLTAVLSPIILLLAFFCTTFSGGAEHNRTVADLCFHGGAVPEGTPEEYQAYIQELCPAGCRHADRRGADGGRGRPG